MVWRESVSSFLDFFNALTPDAGELVVRRDGGLVWVIFNSPRTRNALTETMHERLLQTCQEVNADPSARVMVLTGTGGSFVSGGNIAEFRSIHTPDDALRLQARITELSDAIDAVRVPIVAAIAGVCTGGGAALAAGSDVWVASPSARYGYPIARTLGNCLPAREYGRLVAFLGLPLAKDLLLTARLLDAGELLARGLAREVVASEEALIPRAQALAEQIAQYAPLTLQVSKEALRRARERLLPDNDADLFLRCHLSADFQEGVEAFLAKRAPVWRGE
jgi:enoyl-CoA hydratase/carnithine racemase